VRDQQVNVIRDRSRDQQASSKPLHDPAEECVKIVAEVIGEPWFAAFGGEHEMN
jgi:hypothetical protein